MMKVVAYLNDIGDECWALSFSRFVHTKHKPLVELTPALQELVEAAINMDNVKGRHHSQIAMERLSKAAKAFNEAGK